jgi:hypothetical protein
MTCFPIVSISLCCSQYSKKIFFTQCSLKLSTCIHILCLQGFWGVEAFFSPSVSFVTIFTDILYCFYTLCHPFGCFLQRICYICLLLLIKKCNYIIHYPLPFPVDHYTKHSVPICYPDSYASSDSPSKASTHCKFHMKSSTNFLLLLTYWTWLMHNWHNLLAFLSFQCQTELGPPTSGFTLIKKQVK